MSAVVRQSVWFGRFVLAAATLLLGSVAMKFMVHPAQAVADHGITLATPDAVTAMRVSGGIFLAIAIIMIACLSSERRLLIGLAVLSTIASVILAVRLVGLGLDGPGPFTLRVLKPEVVLVLFSGVGVWLERRRRRYQSGRISSSIARG
jgi:hypothetical protein